jgi:putative sterol carrier protein
MATTDSSAAFFGELAARGHESLLGNASGVVRFDLVDGEKTDRWLVTLDRGDVSVSRKNAAADCIVRANKALFDAMAVGEVNALAAYLRGELALEGDPELLVLVQRVFPGPATTRSGRDVR